jgi:hypothetical protein
MGWLTMFDFIVVAGRNMSTVPIYLVALFLLTTLLALLGFALAVKGQKTAVGLSLFWICIQSAVALSGFYLYTKTLPPRFFLAPIPAFLAIGAVFLLPRGRVFIDHMSLKWSVLLHSIRILVEANLYLLFLYKQVPAQLTFEAGNLDILIGISAPLIWWAYSAGHVQRRGLLIWNSLALLSVLNALGRALLSAPFRFQQFAFQQPTTAILTFPFILLPAFVVPAVIFTHLSIFRKLRLHGR